MFLHIGNNVLIKKEDIIGVFNISSLLEDTKGKKFYNEVRQNRDTMDVSGGKHSSIILARDEVYISRISSATLLGRSDGTMEDMLSTGSGPVPVKKEG